MPTPEEAHALSPLDGRYAFVVEPIADCFSDYELTRQRVSAEIGWLHVLIFNEDITTVPENPREAYQALQTIATGFDLASYEHIKAIETTTNHDVKAVEVYISDQICAHHRCLLPYLSLIHFGCTSEDINSFAYARMLQRGIKKYNDMYLSPLIDALDLLRIATAEVAMLSHTHGQTASPTTMGKELNVFCKRLHKQRMILNSTEIPAKWSGATGNFNAHLAAYPDFNWDEFAKQFITQCGLDWNGMTTQIEPHDEIAMVANTMSAINNILTDLSVDMWLYISKGYFGQQIVEDEVGSSTMPHKVNPINFENAEGNFGIATALFRHFADKLTKSRMQRDLSDSTVMRSVGTAFGYSALACVALQKGLDKVVLNEDNIANELNSAYEVLAEGIQTIMRRFNVPDAYDQLKELTRTEAFQQGDSTEKHLALQSFINELDIPEEGRDLLLKLHPITYIGYAAIKAYS